MPSQTCPIPIIPSSSPVAAKIVTPTSSSNSALIIGCSVAAAVVAVLCGVLVWQKMKKRGPKDPTEEGQVVERVESSLGLEGTVEEGNNQLRHSDPLNTMNLDEPPNNQVGNSDTLNTLNPNEQVADQAGPLSTDNAVVVGQNTQKECYMANLVPLDAPFVPGTPVAEATPVSNDMPLSGVPSASVH